MAEAVEKKLKLPDDAEELVKKKKFKKLKTSITIGIDNDGSVKKLDCTAQADLDSVNGALQKAINACSPFANAPATKDGMFQILIKFDGEHVKAMRP